MPTANKEIELALLGGPRIRSAPFPSWPYFEPDEIAAATRVLESGKVNYWTGDEGKSFEKEFANHCGVRYAVAVANGTVALELALYALGIGPGDEVVTTPRTFVASASCAVLRGATPVFADVDPVSQNLTASAIAQKLTRRTRAIIVVHLAGWPCEMDPILDLARAHGLSVIEDCAQSHGATYQGRPVGSLGDIAAFSFCQDKIMTTGGEGGMLTTNNEEVWRRAWEYKDHGKSWDALSLPAPTPGFRWLHESFGTNWRLTEVQSAIGRVQLAKLDDSLAARRRNAEVLHRKFATIDAVRVTVPPAHIGHAYYKYYTFLKPELLRAGWERDRIVEAVNAEGIPCFSGSCGEIYLEKAFLRAGLYDGHRLSVAKELGETSLMFLVHPTLDEADMADTASAVAKVLDCATAP